MYINEKTQKVDQKFTPTKIAHLKGAKTLQVVSRACVKRYPKKRDTLAWRSPKNQNYLTAPNLLSWINKKRGVLEVF